MTAAIDASGTHSSIDAVAPTRTLVASAPATDPRTQSRRPNGHRRCQPGALLRANPGLEALPTAFAGGRVPGPAPRHGSPVLPTASAPDGSAELPARPLRVRRDDRTGPVVEGDRAGTGAEVGQPGAGDPQARTGTAWNGRVCTADAGVARTVTFPTSGWPRPRRGADRRGRRPR
jgi:hypothetical protein